ncbi:MAG: hypothetical protein EOO04_33585 [Chitinophagaceae bacterium]|nr:MAG: hypothetical protein EOO04_33585 [Chitinophagaceae bacterium]
MIINSFYAEENEQYDDDDLIPLEDIDFDRYDLNHGFDHKADEDEEEEEEQEWQTKIQYALNHLDNFLLYINAEWR